MKAPIAALVHSFVNIGMPEPSPAGTNVESVRD